MQDRPTGAELLRAIADLLENEVLPAVRGPLQHQVRVAGNLCRILEREAELGRAHDAQEIELLSQLLGSSPGDHDARALAAELVERLDGREDELERRAWQALLRIVRGKLAIAKPGHDAYDFEAELG